MNHCVLEVEVMQAPTLRYTQDNQTPIAEMDVRFDGLRAEDAPGQLKVVGWGNLAQDLQNRVQIGQRLLPQEPLPPPRPSPARRNGTAHRWCPTPTTSPSDLSSDAPAIALKTFAGAHQQLTQFPFQCRQVEAKLRPAAPIDLLEQPGPILIQIVDQRGEISQRGHVARLRARSTAGLVLHLDLHSMTLHPSSMVQPLRRG